MELLSYTDEWMSDLKKEYDVSYHKEAEILAQLFNEEGWKPWDGYPKPRVHEGPLGDNKYKAGSIREALRIARKERAKNPRAWNALVHAFRHSEGKVFEVFKNLIISVIVEEATELDIENLMDALDAFYEKGSRDAWDYHVNFVKERCQVVSLKEIRQRIK